MTALYCVIAGVCLAGAAWRKPDWIAATLAAGFAASIATFIWPPAAPLPPIAAIDGMTCLAMAAIWTRYDSMRAWSVGIVGMAKTGATLAAYLIDANTVFLPYAMFINAAFLAQIVIAGGWVDGVGSRLDCVLAGLAPVRHSLLRHGAR